LATTGATFISAGIGDGDALRCCSSILEIFATISSYLLMLKDLALR
jgi:hypothetical protein